MAEPWTTERIEEGFERFRKEHGRLPLAPEVDHVEYLPSSRLIQKRFGGLALLRSRLGYKDNHFGKGAFRSAIAIRVNKRGRDVERSLEKTLQNMFGEVFVHTEKIFDSTKNRVDFYVYSHDGNFGVDVFYSETMRYMQSNINIKMNKYRNFPHQLFLVAANSEFKQEELEKYARSKTRPLPENTRIVTLETLLHILEGKRAYSNPLP